MSHPTRTRTRTRTTQLGNIASEELTQIGAGKEGWLVNNPYLLTSLHTNSLALANKSMILILGWVPDPFVNRVVIHPTLSPINSEYISALQWLDFDDDDHIRVLCVGTSSGYLCFYSLDGSLILKQMIHPSRILKIRVGGKRGEMARDISSGEVCIVMEGIIARVDGSDLLSLLHKWFEETQSNYLDHKQKRRSVDDLEISSERVPYQLWNVNKYGVCVDAAITGIMPPPLLEFESSQRYYCAVTIGNDAVISAYRLSADKSRSIIGAIISRVVPATFSTIASFSKLIWRSDQSSPKKSEPKPQPFARASPMTCLKDPPRKGEKLTLSPSGTLAAVTDSLGRILLLDARALVVVRLWKGYRDASCLFMEMLVDKEAASTSYHEHGKSDYCLCLAIHAPKKGIIEVWQMRTGPRLLTIKCAEGSKILQPTRSLSSSTGSSSSSSYVPLEVFVLNGDSGQLSVINRSLS